MTAKYIIIGKNGQLGSALMNLLGDKAIGFSHTDYDFSDIAQIEKALKNIGIITIFNAAAYTNVDKAEAKYEEALKANAKIPETLAHFCKKHGIPLIHYSTDYVYSGEGTQANKETDAPCPINKYGQSKLEGEKYILSSDCKYLIFRTSWVYDAAGKNFLTTMLR
jgi:dTDP-4-dehydrorhamnose reductase